MSLCAEGGVIYGEQGVLRFGCGVCGFDIRLGLYATVKDVQEAERWHHDQSE